MSAEKLAIANEILRTLGGGRFKVMTGAKNFLALDSGVRFTLPGWRGFCKDGINRVEVILDPSDTYTVIFARIRKTKSGLYNSKVVAKISDVYNDALRGVFESYTGLRTSL